VSDASDQGARSSGRRSVFINYRRLDDEPPPNEPKAKGFVRYLHEQLRWELKTLGVPEGVLWLDRYKLQNDDDFTTVIREELERSDILLAIVSWNYIQSGWCRAEIEAFAHAQKAANDAAEPLRRPIFRIDKQDVPVAHIPQQLREINAIRFFAVDPETGTEQEYFYRGKVVRRKPYYTAIHDLAQQIFRRLQDLGLTPVQPETRPEGFEVTPTGRTIYLAKPGADLASSYDRLVKELEGLGHAVVPPPERELPSDGSLATRAIAEALAGAELSIHLLGERRGFRPDGLEDGIIPLQLAAAADEAARRPGFTRLIWAPKIIPDADGAAAGARRDPLQVLEGFGSALGPQDAIEGDTCSRFVDLLRQRLAGKTKREESKAKVTIYVSGPPSDQKLIGPVARQIRDAGGIPVYGPLQPPVLRRADHVICCWGAADEPAIMEHLEAAALQEWRGAHPSGQLVLVTFPPETATKETACDVEVFGAATLVLDSAAADFQQRLQALIGTAS
jgi:hypothetical protein